MIALAKASSMARSTIIGENMGQPHIMPIEKYIKIKSKTAADINLIRVLRRSFLRSLRRAL